MEIGLVLRKGRCRKETCLNAENLNMILCEIASMKTAGLICTGRLQDA